MQVKLKNGNSYITNVITKGAETTLFTDVITKERVVVSTEDIVSVIWL